MSLSITNQPLRASWIDVACSTQLSKIDFNPRAGRLPNLGWARQPFGASSPAPNAAYTLWVINLAEQFLRLAERIRFVKGVVKNF